MSSLGPEIKASCTVCGARRDLVAEDDWFFIGGPQACVHVCSPQCLLKWAFAKVMEKAQARRKQQDTIQPVVNR